MGENQIRQMSTLNQDAPPAEAPKGNFVKLPNPPASDSYVMTAVAYNFIPEYDFEREDEKTKKKYIKKDKAVELFFGGLDGTKPFFVKTWPLQYSLFDNAKYSKYYTALVGAKPAGGSKPNDMIGKAGMVEIELQNKVSPKGTQYVGVKIKTVSKVPSLLSSTIVPVDKLRPALDEILTKTGEKEEAPF